MDIRIEEKHHRFIAFVADKPTAVVPYKRTGDVTILEATRTSVESWHTGLAETLFGEVLRILRDRGERITIECPLMRAYLDANPAEAAKLARIEM